MMRETVERQPVDLGALLDDRAPVEEVAELLRGRRLLLVGTGTSWHAANQRGLGSSAGPGCEAWPLPADASLEVALPARATGSSL